MDNKDMVKDIDEKLASAKANGVKEGEENARKEFEETIENLKKDIDQTKSEVKRYQGLGEFGASVKNEAPIYPMGRALWAFANQKAGNFNAIDELHKQASEKNDTEAKQALKFILSSHKSHGNTGAYNRVESRVKDLGVGDIASGGGLIDPNAEAEFIDLFRNNSVIRDSGVQVIPARNGVFYYNKKSASSSGYWVGENTAITESEPTFSQVEGRLKKMGVLIPISNDLLRLGDGSQFRTIEQDAIAELTETENAAFLDGSGTAYTPLGLFRVNSGTASNGDTAGQIGDDFTEAIQRLATLKVPTDNLRFVLHTSKYYSALKQVDSNSNQTYYARELANSGTIWGVPVIQSSQAPTNQMLLYRVNDVAIGQGYGLTVDLSDQTNFGQDQTLLRALASVDIVAKRDQAFDTTTSVTWA